MKIKIVNDKGEEEEIESFSQEEVDAKMKEKEEEFGAKLKEKDEALSSLQNEKVELENKLNGTKEDHPNFKILKDALAKKDDEIAKINSEITKDREERKVSSLIMKLSHGNSELEKKIKFHLENTVSGMKSDTEEALQKKVEAAHKLSVDVNSQGIFDGGVGGGGAGDGGAGNGGTGVEFTAREKALGAKLGITEEDYKKYGPKLKK